MTSNTSVFWKLYKSVYGLIMPMLTLIIVVTAILSFFEAKEGSHSRAIALGVLLVAGVLALVLKLIHKKKTDGDVGYRQYVSKIVKKIEPSTLIPLLVMTVVIVMPFYILVITSVKTHYEASDVVFTWWPRNGFDLSSYRDVFALGETWGMPVGRSLLNAFVYAFLPTIVGLFVSAMSAYAFSKLHFRGRDSWFSILLMTIMMPGCVTMSTSYLVYDNYGWTNSALPIIVPGMFGGATIVMFLREFFMGIPDGLLEAARIDGCGKWKIFLKIMLPLGKPALIAQFILTFITRYNDFMNALIYLNNPEKYTIQILLSFMENLSIDASMVATTCVVSLVPMLLLYVVFQKSIIDGISMSSGIKG